MQTQGVNSTPHLARVTHAKHFRVRLKIAEFASSLKRSQCSWLDCIPFPLRYSTPSPLYPLKGSTHRNPQQGVPFSSSCRTEPDNRFSRLAVCSTEVTTMLLSSRRASIGSTYNSGEDIGATPASSEVDERPNLGMVVSSLLTKERERQVQHHSGFITLTWTNLSHVHHTFEPSRGDPRPCTHTRESQAEMQMFCRSLPQREKESPLSIKKSAISLNCEQIMPLKEKAGLSKLSEAEYHTRLRLEEEKNHFFCLKHDPS